jgi:integrase
MPTKVLTSAFVRAAICPPERNKIDYFDFRNTGFFLEVLQSERKTYYQRYSDSHGRQRQYKIGPANVLSLSQARSAARKILAQSFAGEDPQAIRVAKRKIPRVAEFARERYLPYVRTYKRSWDTDERLLRVHVLPRIGNLFMDEVRAEHFQEMLQSMTEAGYAPGTCGRAVVIPRYMFSLALKWKVPGIRENPASGLSLPPDNQRNRFLTAPEIERLLHVIKHDQNQVAAKAILLLLLTGARRNEITQAQWDQVDLDRGVLVVPVSKSGRPRRVVLNEPALKVLRSISRDQSNPYIFPSQVTGKPCPSLFFPWNRIRRRANIPDVRLHDLRHSFASLLINDGVPLYEVQRLLGHSNPRTTQRYAHLAPETLADAAKVAGDVIASLMPESDDDEDA